jgi:hypothetical protein
MPTYNPKDMAYVLQMSKTGGKYTPDELALMQSVNQAMGGGMANMPTQAMAQPAAQPMGQPQGQPVAMPQGIPQGQPMNRLAQIQAAANQVMAGQENPEGQRMANIAKYFQGRQ